MTNMKAHYDILDLTEEASEEEVKKRYRELAKKYHPDNINTGDAEKFKKITEAYKTITDPPKATTSPPFGSVPFSGAYPFGFNFDRDVDVSPVELHTVISFAESVLGIKKEFVFNRKSKCAVCRGEGVKVVNNGCTSCNGNGKFVRRQGNTIIMSPCGKCNGRNITKECEMCDATGSISSQVSVNVSIPAGIVNGNILRLSNMGNFIGNFGPIEQYTDALLHISVTPDCNFSISGNDVISHLDLSLDEAVKGCKKTVKTVTGTCEIEIAPMSRNKEEVIIPKMGVNKQGCQRVILDVRYPDNIMKIIDSLLSGDN